MKIITTHNKSLKLGEKTVIMGILNITPDSFSDGGKYFDVNLALKQTEKLIKDGADIIDIGGESTRPNHTPVSETEELERVIPIIKAIKSNYDVLISIDTSKAEVAKQAIQAGAHIVNDVWGCQKDPQMAKIVAEYDVCLIAMHNSNTKEYKNGIVEEMISFFDKTIEILKKENYNLDKLILDPGIGFGKDIKLNIEVLKNLKKIKNKYNFPFLLATSRKNFIGLINQLDNPEDRIAGTVATTVIGIEAGYDIVRVHDVKYNKEAAEVADAIYRNRNS